LCKKSDAAEAIKAVFQLWSNTTFYFVKCLHTDNRGEYMTLELQSFLHEQGIVHETSTSTKWLSRMVELDTTRKGTICYDLAKMAKPLFNISFSFLFFITKVEHGKISCDSHIITECHIIVTACDKEVS